MNFDIGQILNRIFIIWLKNFLSLALVSLVVHSPLLVLALIAHQTGDLPHPTAPEIEDLSDLWYSFTEIFLRFFLTALMTAAITHGTLEALRGKNIEVSDSLMVGVKVMLPVLWVSFCLQLITALGCAACAVPGILIHVIYFVTIPVLVTERPRMMESFGRSQQLTKGLRWHIFAIVAVIWIAYSALVGVFAFVQIGISMSALTYALLMFGVVVFIGPFLAVTSAVVYHGLKQAKEGLGDEDLTEVFR